MDLDTQIIWEKGKNLITNKDDWNIWDKMVGNIIVISIDAIMAISYFIIGFVLIKSKGEGIRYLTGHEKDEEITDKSVEVCNMCGRKIIGWSMPFVVGIVIDCLFVGVGFMIAVVFNLAFFVRLLFLRKKMES